MCAGLLLVLSIYYKSLWFPFPPTSAGIDLIPSKLASDENLFNDVQNISKFSDFLNGMEPCLQDCIWRLLTFQCH